jgi:hypothetical protein
MRGYNAAEMEVAPGGRAGEKIPMRRCPFQADLRFVLAFDRAKAAIPTSIERIVVCRLTGLITC